MNKYTTHRSHGFALLDIFLAMALLVIVSVSVYQVIGVYKKKMAVQTLENDLIRIAEAYTPVLNTPAFNSTGLNTKIMLPDGYWISTNFLKSIPIPDERISTPTKVSVQSDADGDGVFDTNELYASYLLTNLPVNGTWADVGFESLSTDSPTAPPIRYLLMGITLECQYAKQIIQDLNNQFSLFFGKTSDTIAQAKPVTTLPSCSTKTTAVNLYLVTPALTDNGALVGTFKAPDPGIK